MLQTLPTPKILLFKTPPILLFLNKSNYVNTLFLLKCFMGLVYADIELFNLSDEILCEDGYLPKEKIRQMTINAMADSGAIRLAINENIRQQLGLRVRQQLDISLADGTKRRLDVAGPVRLKFRDRDCITDTFVLPEIEEPLIGAVPMELMDLVVIPAESKLDYNPKDPVGPFYSIK